MRQTLSVLMIALFATLAVAVEIEPRPATSSTVGIQIDGLEGAHAAAEKLAQEKSGPAKPRAIDKRRQALDRDELLQRRLEGKMDQVDVLSGALVYDHVTDYLPENWGKRHDLAGAADSLGNPIVNTVPGLPGWAEHNIEALRTEIRQALAKLDAATDQDRAEYELVLGNFVGQALVRGLDVGDVIALSDARISANVTESIVNQLRFYENLKAVRAEGMGYRYTKSDYSDDVVDFIEAAGHSMEQVLEVAAAQTKATPSGWYNMTTFPRGMSNLSGATTIWIQSGDDDAAADVPIPWSWYFYPLDDPDHNLSVRVSTNGYISFYQQGGGAENGTDYSNDEITSTLDPDGYIAPSWDDYIVATAQGNADKVSYLTEGALGERVFTVEWFSMSRLGGTADDYHFFQVKLFEATGNIELHTSDDWNADSLDGSTVGMEDFDGVDGDCGPNCLNTNTLLTIPDNYMFSPDRPVNDAWANAICVAADAPVVGSSFGARPDNPPITPTCGFNSIHDVWYWYHSPAIGNVTFDTCTGTAFDTVLGVFDSTQTEIGCNDDFCGVQSSVVVAAGNNQDYLIRVAGYNSGQGDFLLTATPTSTPGGDYCANAWVVTSGFSGFTYNNTGCIDETFCGYRDTLDEWFSWTAPANGTTTVTTCDALTDFDTTLAVFSSCGGAEIACNDDAVNCPSGPLQSTVEFMATSGSTYFFRIAGYNYAHGNYRFSVTQNVIEPHIFSDGFESGDTNGWSSTSP
jgi:hypothetical protein